MALTRRPNDKVHGDGDGLLGLAGDVAGNHGQGERLGGPEGEGNVVADEEANLLGTAVKGHGHEADGADKRRDDKAEHDEQRLVRLLDQPDGTEQHNDNVEAEDHGEQLGLEDVEAKAGDDDALERAETRGGQRRAESNQGVAPALRIQQGLDGLLTLEDAVLDTCLILAHTLNHEHLVLLGEALGTHRAVGHPPADKKAKDDGDDTVGQEDPLPRLERASLDQAEAIGQQTTDNLLGTVHHVPVGNTRGLLLTAVPDTGQDNKCRLAGRLKETEQRAENDQALEIVAGSRAKRFVDITTAHQNNTHLHSAG